MAPPRMPRKRRARAISAAVAGQGRAHRCAEALGKAHADRVDLGREVGLAARPRRRPRSTAERHPGGRAALLARESPPSPAAGRERPDGAAAAIVGVLEGQRGVCGRTMSATRSGRAGASRRADGRLDQAVGAALDGRSVTPHKAAGAPRSWLDDVAAGLGQDLVAGLGVAGAGRAGCPWSRWGRRAPPPCRGSRPCGARAPGTVGSSP